MSAIQKKINSKIGILYLVATKNALKSIIWNEQPVPMLEDDATNPAALILLEAELQINEYLEGKRKNFDLPLEAEGTNFQKRVWEALSRIPYGTTCSYKDIALVLQHKKASRAVGTANGRNPLSIIVPCHRVISSDGSLGGYAGGLDVKKKLLAIEKVII